MLPRFVLIKVDELSEQTGHGASKLLGCAAKVEGCHLYEHIFFYVLLLVENSTTRNDVYVLRTA